MNLTNLKDYPAVQKFTMDPMIFIFFSVFNSLICGNIIGVMGILGNIFNIRNFYKQGLSDSVLVTLTALSISDIGALVTQLVINSLSNPWLFKADINIEIQQISTLFFYTNDFFIRVSGLITTFAMFERCLSVIVPLKVKLIITKKVALLVNISVFLVLALYIFVLYYGFCVGFVYLLNHATNRTMLTMIYRKDSEMTFQVSYLLVDMALPYCCFVVTIVCTVAITVTLKRKSMWRASNAMDAVKKNPKSESVKDVKTTTMLVTVSIIFVVCLVPHSTILTALGIHRELNKYGVYFDIACVCYTFTFLFETINCSVSCVVYYKMSRKYREVTHDMLTFCKTNNR